MMKFWMGRRFDKSPYRAKSEAPDVDTLVPANIRSSISSALDNLEQEVGNLDDYVSGRLGIQNRETLYSRYSGRASGCAGLSFQ